MSDNKRFCSFKYQMTLKIKELSTLWLTLSRSLNPPVDSLPLTRIWAESPSLLVKLASVYHHHLLTSKMLINSMLSMLPLSYKVTFDTVDFACSDCPTRSARSVESSSTCQPTTSTSIRSFSVLFLNHVVVALVATSWLLLLLLIMLSFLSLLVSFYFLSSSSVVLC